MAQPAESAKPSDMDRHTGDLMFDTRLLMLDNTVPPQPNRWPNSGDGFLLSRSLLAAQAGPAFVPTSFLTIRRSIGV
jgi:hypothetical protein